MKHFAHLNSAIEITGMYNGKLPFHLFIKDFFRQHKKYGSSDRKQITHLCYCYFRLGKSMQHKPVQEKMLTALFLCTDQNNELLAAFKPEWNEKINLSIEEKCALLHIPFEPAAIFPCPHELSEGINKNDFIFSHLTQPDLFIRTRPGYHQAVIDKLTEAGITFLLPYNNCIGVPNQTKIDALVNINKEAVIQDLSSQRTGAFMQDVLPAVSPLKVWDCCAASGGKSIMAKDILGNIDLTVSDNRETILIHLKKRFTEADIHNYRTLLADLTKPVAHLRPASFDLIVADAPCTGSGTWGRTPERLLFFDEKEIGTCSSLQKKIIHATMPYLKSGGYFLYITCSAYKKENEEVADFIQKKFAADLVKMEILKGYSMKADTMFAALFRKS
jgi:16S rRNA (cytosine967-C5)-methyltransferase